MIPGDGWFRPALGTGVVMNREESLLPRRTGRNTEVRDGAHRFDVVEQATFEDAMRCRNRQSFAPSDRLCHLYATWEGGFAFPGILDHARPYTGKNQALLRALGVLRGERLLDLAW